jgi:hypothetical protein
VPRTNVIFYRDEKNSAPVLDWLRELHARDFRGWTHVRARIQLLAEHGHEPPIIFLMEFTSFVPSMVTFSSEFSISFMDAPWPYWRTPSRKKM